MLNKVDFLHFQTDSQKPAAGSSYAVKRVGIFAFRLINVICYLDLHFFNLHYFSYFD